MNAGLTGTVRDSVTQRAIAKGRAAVSQLGIEWSGSRTWLKAIGTPLG
ncbi:MAG: hypothetical protein MH252_16975 [Thermosynechococcaceae cyanobacterium MS004]|nr:hypothetical protein [Thermosynechococcaceae cyanobacterium MS004]